MNANQNKTMFVLGAAGFIGQQVVREAVASGWNVKGLVRSRQASQQIMLLGAAPVLGDVNDPSAWIAEVQNVHVLIDLIQPKIPSRLTFTAIQKLSAERQQLTQKILDALKQFPNSARPLFISVSGTDDLAPDSQKRVGSFSKLKQVPSGFGHIGIPVRRLIENSGIHSAFVYLGSVYGPGKTFAEIILPRLAKGRWKTIGDGTNRTPLVHVEDAARGLVHIAELDQVQTRQQTFVLADASATTTNELFDHAALLLGAKLPGKIPPWLASLVVGNILVETMTRDLIADPSGLSQTGFRFKYPSYREGLPPTLKALRYSLQSTENAASSKSVSQKNGLPFWPMFIATLGVIAAENLMSFKLSIPYMSKLSGGLPILDMRPWYTPEDAYHLLDVMGTSGRNAYWQLFFTVDILIPLLAILFLWSALSRGAFRKFRSFALVGGIADYLENIVIMILLANYPDHLNGLVTIAACFTLVKHLSYISGLGLAVLGYVLKVFSQKKKEAAIA